MAHNKPQWLDSTIPKFLLVGVGNTLVSLVIMMALEGWGYWASTAIAYVVGGILSFCLNRTLTFRSEGRVLSSALKFAINVAVCYLLAYGLAQPVGGWVLSFMPLSLLWQERLIKLGGMGLYTVLNYIGQRWFAFAT